MAASYPILCSCHRLLLLPLLMLNMHLYCVLSYDGTAPDCIPIRLPFNHLDAPPNGDFSVSSCSEGVTWISLFSQTLFFSNISYSERRIDIHYDPMVFKEYLCRPPEEPNPQADKLFPLVSAVQSPHVTVFKCDESENLEGLQKLGVQNHSCADGSALYISPCPDFKPPPAWNCCPHKIAAPAISNETFRGPPETFSVRWKFDWDSGSNNLPACHCKDGSAKPSDCKGAITSPENWNKLGHGTSRKGKKIIIGSMVAAVASFLLACLLFFFTRSFWLSSSRRSPAENGCFQLHTPTKVEKFLIDYKALTATRYTYNDILKMTKKFECKLGQGGYASVYQGRLPNGTPVAVKLMEKTYNDGEEFCNEVATIGRIHHVNVIRLLGFCAEGSRRALVYEFMANGSLDKFISTTIAGHCLFKESLYDIALGIARGIEYLHQGCDRRIIHFDIKPHNILLDLDFTPKISDFGLSKSYCKERSIVTITDGKGTIGYIAPELVYGISRHASHKSDVYNCGMLLLSMVGMKEQIGPTDGSSNEAYFPQWIHKALSENQKFEGIREGEDEMIRKIATIALWCIQWNPNDRPSMKEVVRMLESSTSNLTMPPNHLYPATEPQYMIRGIDSSSISE